MTNYRTCVKCDTTFRTRSLVDRETKCEMCRPAKANKYAGISKRNTKLLKEWEDMQERVLLLEAAVDASLDAISIEMDHRIQDYIQILEENLEQRIDGIIKKRLVKINSRLIKLTDDVSVVARRVSAGVDDYISKRKITRHPKNSIMQKEYRKMVDERRRNVLHVLAFFGDLNAHEIRDALIQKYGTTYTYKNNTPLYADMRVLVKRKQVVSLPVIKGEMKRWKAI